LEHIEPHGDHGSTWLAMAAGCRHLGAIGQPLGAMCSHLTTGCHQEPCASNLLQLAATCSSCSHLEPLGATGSKVLANMKHLCALRSTTVLSACGALPHSSMLQLHAAARSCSRVLLLLWSRSSTRVFWCACPERFVSDCRQLSQRSCAAAHSTDGWEATGVACHGTETGAERWSELTTHSTRPQPLRARQRTETESAMGAS
jgi:hypothetical protein